MYPPPALLTPNTNTLLPSAFHRHRETSVVIENLKEKAEVCHGDKSCREKFMLLLTEIGLPNGLLILQDIEECGLVRDTGFVWLKHKEKRKYCRFDNIDICYDTFVTAYFEQNKIKNLTGVKAKEFLIWISLSEIYVDYKTPAASITFKTPAGLSKSFPLSMFKSIVSHKEDAREVDEIQANQGHCCEM